MQKYQLFIGIDISKKWIDACLSTDGKKPGMPHQRFDNQVAGFKKMFLFAKSFAQKQGIEGRWLLCMEHTGIYALPLCKFLEESKEDYVLQSPLEIANSLGIRRGKSDKADSADIARYLYLHHEELNPTKLPSGTLLKIKHLLSLRTRLKKAQTGLATAAKELKGHVEAAMSKEVVSISKSTKTHLNRQINQVEKDVRQLIRESEELNKAYELATSVIGVGLLIGASMLVYTNGFTAFRDGRQFACYAGFAPFEHTSGTSVKKPAKVSQLANKKLKALIGNGAMSAIQHDKELRAYYHQKIAEGKNKFLVQNNVKNKLVQRIFAVVNRGTPYVELSKFKAK